MHQLTQALIKLEIESEASLFIMLSADGTINRQGDGSMVIDKNLFLGVTNTRPMLDELNDLVTPEFSEFLNMVYDLPEKKGKNCLVEIILGWGDQVKGVKFLYGNESMGPPTLIRDFIIKAEQLTEPWFIEQQKMIKRSKKKWWQIWK